MFRGFRRFRGMKKQRRFRNMNIFRGAAAVSGPRLGRRLFSFLMSLPLLLVPYPQSLSAYQDPQAPPQAEPAPPYTQQTAEQLQQLVAPIALYPESLVAQILATSTFPE